MDDAFDRIGIVVHPRRELSAATATLRSWAEERGAEVVQLQTNVEAPELAPRGEVADCDLVVALGGDGTTLAALHAAGPAGKPVLGVACGSLGALSAVTAEELEDALERVGRGEWTGRAVPALHADHGDEVFAALNDLVLVRAGGGQIAIELELDGEPVIRYGGDGLVAATPMGSSAYTLAVGGPMLAPGTAGLVLTPLAPHGGVCPPIVTPPGAEVVVTVNPGHGGARAEVDGQVQVRMDGDDPHAFSLRFEPEHAVLVHLGDGESMIAGLRRRRVLIDSPRVQARDDREAAARDAVKRS
jgi:NAD+ kinase